MSVEVCAVASMFSERITTAKHCFGLEYIISLPLTLGVLRILIMGGRGGGDATVLWLKFTGALVLDRRSIVVGKNKV